VIVIGIPEEKDIILVNPEIVRRKGERLVTEGCLSIPGYVGQISRAESVTAKGLDASGKEIRIKAEGLLAQALEHEVDHLNGKLYIDHMASMDTLRKIEPEETEI
jgi:peptide deformylase